MEIRGVGIRQNRHGGRIETDSGIEFMFRFAAFEIPFGDFGNASSDEAA
jgi:hypothetical protein